MVDELQYCFFCGRPLSIGNVAGVICDSISCKAKLIRMFNILASVFNDHKNDIIGALENVPELRIKMEKLMEALIDTKEDFEEMWDEHDRSMNTLAQELSWLDNILKDEKLSELKERMSSIRALVADCVDELTRRLSCFTITKGGRG